MKKKKNLKYRHIGIRVTDKEYKYIEDMAIQTDRSKSALLLRCFRKCYPR